MFLAPALAPHHPKPRSLSLSRRRPDTDDILAVVALHYANGTPRYPLRYIAALFGCGREHISIMMRREGLPRRRRFATKASVLPGAPR